LVNIDNNQSALSFRNACSQEEGLVCFQLVLLLDILLAHECEGIDPLLCLLFSLLGILLGNLTEEVHKCFVNGVKLGLSGGEGTDGVNERIVNGLGILGGEGADGVEE